LDEGEVVWWAADLSCASYYKLPLSQPVSNNPKAAKAIINPTLSEVSGLGRPDVVILSKKDLFDREKGIADYLEKNNFRLTQTYPAFRIFKPVQNSSDENRTGQ
jgi:hypothetical protein